MQRLGKHLKLNDMHEFVMRKQLETQGSYHNLLVAKLWNPIFYALTKIWGPYWNKFL